MNYTIQKVNINTIVCGDTIIHEGKMRTVGKSNITNSTFMGKAIFGDSYKLGYKPVEKVIFQGDKYNIIRPYLAILLSPKTLISTSHITLANLQGKYGESFVSDLLECYWEEFGENGQRKYHENHIKKTVA